MEKLAILINNTLGSTMYILGFNHLLVLETNCSVQSYCLSYDMSPSTASQFLGVLNAIWSTEEAVKNQMGNTRNVLTVVGELEGKSLQLILSLVH